LQPENILIGKRCLEGLYAVKVADFGLSTLMKADEMLSTACGSPHYVAPEILTFDGTACYDGLLGDVWSLGVILHVMLLYKLPFEAESTQLLYKKIRQGLPSLPACLSSSAASLLQGMLTVAPERRMTLVQVVQHEWPQLQEAAASLVVSQTVDAVVDFSCSELDGADTFLSASNLFHVGSTSSSCSGDEGAPGSMRRAFTFDTLPSDDNPDAVLFHPSSGVEKHRGRRRGGGSAAGTLKALSPRAASPTHGASHGAPYCASARATSPREAVSVALGRRGEEGSTDVSDGPSDGLDSDTGMVSIATGAAEVSRAQ
jgi:serine/threonine protein kinase